MGRVGYVSENVDLREILAEYRVEDLKYLSNNLLALVKASGAKPAGVHIPNKVSALATRKADRIEWMARCLLSGGLLKFLYTRMGAVPKAAVQEIVHGPSNALDYQSFEAKYDRLPKTTASGSRYSYQLRDDEEVVFRPYSLVVYKGGRMPIEIKALMSKFVPAPRALEVPYLDHLPHKEVLFHGRETAEVVQHDTARAAMADLAAMLQLVDQGKIRVGAKTGVPTKAAVKQIRRVLHGGDFYPEEQKPRAKWDVSMGSAGIRPIAWCRLLQIANLVQTVGTKLELSRTGRAALKKAPQEVLKTLWVRWLKTTKVHEMHRIEIIKGQKSKKRPLGKAHPARLAIAGGLADLTPGQWVRTDDLFNFILAAGNGFSVVRNPWGLYIGDANYGNMGYSHVGFSHLEGRFGRAFLLEYAATLGIIDVALVPPWGALTDFHDLWGGDDLTCLSRYDGLLALRLNALGAWVLGQTETYTPATYDAASLQVLSNLEVTLVGATVSAADRLFMDRVFESVSDRVWRIELTGLLKAVEEGIALKDVVEFLITRNQGDLPQPVSLFLAEAKHRNDRLRDRGQARLFECADVATAQLFANDTKLKNLCFLAGERHLAVPHDNLSLFRNRLRVLGFVVGG